MADATMVNPLGSLSTSLRVQSRPLRRPLMYCFTAEYRAWVDVIQLNEYSRGPMVQARVALQRALSELPVSDVGDAWAAAREATRRRRAWMTVNGRRLLGVGADAERYRSVAVTVGDRMVVAVVPADQEVVELQVSDDYTTVVQHQKAMYALSATGTHANST